MTHLELSQLLLFKGQGILMIKKLFYLILFSFIVAGTDGTIRGKVTDEDGTALVGTQVYIPELEKGVAADMDGNFIMLNMF